MSKSDLVIFKDRLGYTYSFVAVKY